MSIPSSDLFFCQDFSLNFYLKFSAYFYLIVMKPIDEYARKIEIWCFNCLPVNQKEMNKRNSKILLLNHESLICSKLLF